MLLQVSSYSFPNRLHISPCNEAHGICFPPPESMRLTRNEV